MYDSIPSETFNLEILGLDTTGAESPNDGSGKLSIVEQYIYGRPKPYFYGVYFNSRLSFPVSFFSPTEVTAVDLSYIQRWLFARSGYKQLAIIQPDMDDVYFNCILTDPQVVRRGNLIYGVNGTVNCDSEFAWTYPKTLSYSYSSAPSGSGLIFYNNSHYDGYLYPSMTFTMKSGGGDLTITNTSDNSRQFIFTSLGSGEIITIDNDKKIISSSLGYRRLANFNKNFMRFVPGVNSLSITGNIGAMTITYQFARRLGG